MTLRITLVGAGSVARRHVDVLHGLGGQVRVRHRPGR